MCSTSAVTELRTSETRLEFPYTRTVGPVVGGFLSGLRQHRLMGIRRANGEVLVPPVEYDPDTGMALGGDLVEVGPEAAVVSWTWVAEPTSKHPLDHPFAFALLRLDGADAALVHVVDAAGPDEMAMGMRVQPRWRAEPVGMITDIEAWEPVR
jgi:uncharacterized OB-fold protein